VEAICDCISEYVAVQCLVKEGVGGMLAATVAERLTWRLPADGILASWEKFAPVLSTTNTAFLPLAFHYLFSASFLPPPCSDGEENADIVSDMSSFRSSWRASPYHDVSALIREKLYACLKLL